MPDGGWRWSVSDLPQMSLISRCATSQDLHTDALQLEETADRLWLSLIGCMWTSSMPLTHVHPATSALNPQLPLTRRISRVTFDLLTSWKISNALVLPPKAQGSTQSAGRGDWADQKGLGAAAVGGSVTAIKAILYRFWNGKKGLYSATAIKQAQRHLKAHTRTKVGPLLL